MDVLDTPLDEGDGWVMCKPAPMSSHAHAAADLAARLAAEAERHGDTAGGDKRTRRRRESRAGESRGRPARVVGGTEEFATFGLLFHRDDVFDRASLARGFVRALAGEAKVVRFKGVVRVGATEWVAPFVDAASGTVRLDPVAWRRDSRIEVIVEGTGRRARVRKEVGFVDGSTDGEEATAEAGRGSSRGRGGIIPGKRRTRGGGKEDGHLEEAGEEDGHLEGIEEEDEEGYGSDGRDVSSADAKVSADAAGPSAARRDWDAFTAAIIAAVKPDVQSPKKSPNAKRIPGLEDA